MAWLRMLAFPARQEQVALAAMGLAALGIVSAMISVLVCIRDENTATQEKPNTRYITQETEDSLKIETLDELLKHPNVSIREVTANIVRDRAGNDGGVVSFLLNGITSPDYDQRSRCLGALVLIISREKGVGSLDSEAGRTCTALVRSLEFCLTDKATPDVTDGSWDEFPLRDELERRCLSIASLLSAKYNVALLVDAGFVEKWLAKQRWGDARCHRDAALKSYIERKDNPIAEILLALGRSRRGLEALRDAELMEEEDCQLKLENLTRWCTCEGLGGSAAHPQTRRMVEQSAEERRLRRQHREAMVLNDGTSPLRQEDIIQPTNESQHSSNQDW